MTEGPLAFLTGAGSGIGRASALELGRIGYRVVATDHDLAAARTTAGMVDGTAVALRLDVRDLAEAEACVEAAIEWGGGIDLLVNNAGINSPYTVVDTPVEHWDEVFAVNVRSLFYLCRSVIPHMAGRGGGVIVNTASVAGLVGLNERAAYCASKGAVVALTRSLALDHVEQGIRVNCVCPGTVDTPWVDRLADASPDPQRTRSELVGRQPLGRLGTAEEVAKAIAYLASDDAAYITGTALVIDGGWTAR